MLGAMREPRYSIIARQIASDILAGKIAVGQMLPTESELVRDFGASRHTVRSAIKELQSKGLVATRRGRGSEVISARPLHPRVGFSFDSLHNFLTIAEQTRLTGIRKTHDRVSSEIAESTGWKLDERCLCIKAIRSSVDDHENIAYIEIYLRGQYASVESKIGRKPIAISKLVEQEFSLRTKEIYQLVRPQVVSAEVAGKLKVKEGSLGLYVGRRYIADSEETFMYVVSHQAGTNAYVELRMRYDH
jgi:GntR family transcriptional regulator